MQLSNTPSHNLLKQQDVTLRAGTLQSAARSSLPGKKIKLEALEAYGTLEIRELILKRSFFPKTTLRPVRGLQPAAMQHWHPK